MDLGFLGPKFTWERGNPVSGIIRERLDLVLCSIGWRSLFPVAGVRVLPRYSSNHSLLLLSTDLWKESSRRGMGLVQARKFEAMWLDLVEGKRIITESWERGATLQVQERLSDTMHSLSEWHKSEFDDLPKKIKEAEKRLERIQKSHVSHGSIAECKELQMQIEKWQRD